MTKNRFATPPGRGKYAVCAHPLKDEIDAALVAGEPSRVVTERYGISSPSHLRHKANHPASPLVRVHLVEAPSGNGHAEGMEQIEKLLSSCLTSLDAARKTGNLLQIAVAHRELRQAIELMGR